MHYGGLREGVGSDEFVVGGMEGHGDYTDFAGYTFRTPGEITRFETEGAIFGVAATGADQMDTLGADTGVGWLAAFLECSVGFRSSGYETLSVEPTSSCGSMLASHR